MTGKKAFSHHEAARIRHLLAEKQQSDSARKKAIRALLRGIGFYITDFDKSYRGFFLQHFESLVSSRMISIR